MTLLAEIGEALRDAFSDDVFTPAALHVGTATIGEFGETTMTWVDHDGAGFISRWDAETMAARGYDANTAKVVLVQSTTLPKPKLGDEVTATRPITLETERYRVTDVSSDPADATWQVAGVKL